MPPPRLVLQILFHTVQPPLPRAPCYTAIANLVELLWKHSIFFHAPLLVNERGAVHGYQPHSQACGQVWPLAASSRRNQPGKHSCSGRYLCTRCQQKLLAWEFAGLCAVPLQPNARASATPSQVPVCAAFCYWRRNHRCRWIILIALVTLTMHPPQWVARNLRKSSRRHDWRHFHKETCGLQFNQSSAWADDRRLKWPKGTSEIDHQSAMEHLRQKYRAQNKEADERWNYSRSREEYRYRFSTTMGLSLCLYPCFETHRKRNGWALK